MAIRSFLGMAGRKRDEGPSISKPRLPSSREILEDIDSIKKNDPLLSLAAILQKHELERHSIVDNDIKEFYLALEKRQRRESQSQLSPKTKVPNSRLKELGKNETKGDTEDADNKQFQDYKLDYDKFKHFLTTCQHSQELISSIEEEFKLFEIEIAENFNHKEREESHLL